MRNSSGRPFSSASRWIFVLRPPRERPRAGSSQPLFAAGGRLLVCSHDGRVDHQILVFLVSGQIVEDALPHPAARPAHEPRVHAFVFAVTFGKVRPTRTGAKHPQHTVDELTVVRRRSAHMLHSPRKPVLDPHPLRIAQLVSARHTTSATKQHELAKSICGYALAQRARIAALRARPQHRTRGLWNTETGTGELESLEPRV